MNPAYFRTKILPITVGSLKSVPLGADGQPKPNAGKPVPPVYEINQLDDIPNRRQELVLVRREVYHALRGLGWSYPIIAQLCERDHSSVHYAVQKWAEHLTKQATGE